MSQIEDEYQFDLDLTPEQLDLIVSLVDAGFRLSCNLISTYWQKEWDNCPLCEEPVNIDGFCVHKFEH